MTGAEVERSMRLAAQPDSPSAARRLVRDVLTECHRPQWQDAAELAVSELVTNAVLHAHTDVTVRVRCTGTELRVEVEDGSAVMPSQRRYGRDASTGRGMALVAAVTSEHGVTPGRRGKVVWFALGEQPEEEPSTEDLLAAWGDDDFPDVAPPTAERSVTLVGFPPTLWLAAAQQHDAMLRELALLRAGRQQDNADLAVCDRARFALRTALDREIAEARAAGEARSPLPPGHPARLEAVPPLLDLTVAVADTAATDFGMLQDVLDEAQRLALAGELLVRPALPEVVAVRDWAAEQVIAILAGQPARAWPGADAEHFAQVLDQKVRELDFDADQALAGERTGIVADSQNRIVGISDRLAELLGWPMEELIGRRVVAIVPPRFREAHVAGLTRHLTTGEAHALNVDLQLPVLRADGTELLCDFFIEAHRSRSGQPVYVAWITPIPAGGEA